MSFVEMIERVRDKRLMQIMQIKILKDNYDKYVNVAHDQIRKCVNNEQKDFGPICLEAQYGAVLNRTIKESEWKELLIKVKDTKNFLKKSSVNDRYSKTLNYEC